MELVAPHGGFLKEMLANEKKVEGLREEALALPSWDLTPYQAWDIELLLNGAFSPLDGFLTKKEYDSVCERMRLQDGTLWPMPITLDVSESLAESLSEGDRIALRHPEGMMLAVLTVRSAWRVECEREAQTVFGTTDDAHPAVFHLFHHTHSVYLGGPIEGISLPPHYMFKHLYHTPTELRAQFITRGWSRIVAFQPRSPMHRADVELTKQGMEKVKANLLINPTVGMTKPGDIDYFARVRCYHAVLKHYPAKTAMLSLLPLTMRLGGPREAIWHAIIRKNYGCSHFIAERDHAALGNDRNGKPFYDPDAAQKIVKDHEMELGVSILGLEEMVYVKDQARYVPRSKVPQNARILSISGTELQRRLHEGLGIPEWFSYPEVIAELRHWYPPRLSQGFTIFLTGLPGSGKSTIANALLAKLMDVTSRPVTLLDGDWVRKNLSSDLGFSREHRDLNIRRIGLLAGEITKHHGITICALIAPYRDMRREVRDLIGQYGCFVEIYVSTPLEVCEQRDHKGLYAKARAGLIREFTGISDPYEAPENAEIVIDTSKISADEAAERVIMHLGREGLVNSERPARYWHLPE